MLGAQVLHPKLPIYSRSGPLARFLGAVGPDQFGPIGILKTTVKTLCLSARAGTLKPSPTLGISAKANEMKKAGIDVVSFAAGEPDFNTPAPVIEAAVAALHAGFTKYTPTPGTLDLKEAVAAKLERDNGLKYSPDQIVVSCGAKHSVYNTMQILLDPGDEVILVGPYWMTYAEQIKLAGGVPKIVHTTLEQEFVPSREQLSEAITPRTKAFLVNSPTNPTGAVFPRQTLKDIAALALRHGLWIVSDEIYERLVYGVAHESIGSLGADVFEQTITINGCSKTYAMTGWRIGYAAAPKPIAKAMSSLQDQVTSNPTSFAQKGAIVALGLPAADVEVMRQEFETRRDLIVSLLQEIPGVKIFKPKGAFYILPDFSAHLSGNIRTDHELADYLLETAHVATIPGSVFEAPGHLRLTYAASRADIEKGVKRIAEALARRTE